MADVAIYRAALVRRRRSHRHHVDRVQRARSQHTAGVRAVSRHRRRGRAVLRPASGANLFLLTRIACNDVSYVLGLTGGIGSGKSEVAKAFARLGADVLDADAVAHAVSAPGEAGHAAVVEAFGTQCLQPNGAIDRGWLRERAFADPVFRDRLER